MNVEWPFNGVPSSIEDMQEIRQMSTIELSIIYEQAIRMTTKLSFWSTLIHLAEHQNHRKNTGKAAKFFHHNRHGSNLRFEFNANYGQGF